MKLIDELRREQAQPGKKPAQPDLVRPAASVTREVLGAIEALYCGLADLTDGLNQLQTDARVDYAIDSLGTLRNLNQRGYAVLDVDPAVPRFAFAFECLGTRALTRRVPSVTERQQLQVELQSLGLDFSVDTRSALGFTLVVQPFVLVRLDFEPAADGREVRMTAQNLNRLGRELYSIHPTEVSDELVDELGKLVLRRPSRFAELTGNRLSPATRARLRASLESEGRLRPVVAGAAAELQGRGAPPGAIAARGSRERQRPHVAPLLVSKETDVVGPLTWIGEASARKRLPARRAPGSESRGGQVPGADAAFRLVRHAWVITDDSGNDDPSESMVRRGPAGTSLAFPTPRVVSDGERFRLLDPAGRVRFRGKLLGQFHGTEPLEEFGRQHGCCDIEIERDGRWVRPGKAE